MAVSGSTNFVVNRNELINASLRLLGVGVTGETASADEISDASQALNLMLKAWQADGLPLWQRRSVTITLTAAKSVYTMGPSGADITVGRPLRIVQVNRRDSSSNDTPLMALSRQEYWSLNQKTSAGIPVNYYYDPQLTSGSLYIWQVPSATDIVTYPSLIVDYLKPFDDMDGATDDFEFPQEWLEAVKYGLAIRLAPEYGVPIDLRQQLNYEFRGIYATAASWDTEDTSLFFSPDWRR